MTCQNPSRNVRSRTYWTPTMERYFIDLMLEHMHRRNRSGHTFNKQAWTDMLAVFNAKFASQFDKDVLKSHYTNLWKQFNDIKNLLGHNGFSWDETKEMVVADDYVWDEYIKDHPDARPYKTKAVLNFNDLCLIYGYTTADGRYSRSSHDIDVDDEVQGVNAVDKIGCPTPANSEPSRTGWMPAMDQYFIELILNHQEKGSKLDNTFCKQAWTDMLTSFNAKFGPHHNKRVLKHRYKKLWKYYSDITILLKQNGFSWDETQQMVAADGDVWDAYIKAHPPARSYRMKTFPNFKVLGLIFGEAINNDCQIELHQDKKLEGDVSGVKTGNERSRTFWTPPMDRYLIDLLLYQVHRGNRIGQTFNSQAWIDMVTSFNANFISHHDKDVLKNRYKHLRRQYNDIKILLEQGGFSWDETREMVTAEDHVWDSYITAHPDARSYRVKTLPSYDKLSVIYGQDNSDGRYSRLALNVEPDKGIPAFTLVERKDDQSPASTDPMINWTPSMDRCFTDLMLEQVHRGHKIDKTFDLQAWAHMIASFNENFGVQYDKYVLENRYFYLMKQYVDVCNLLNQNGFSWDETQHIVAADDCVWEAYIKEHPNVISYRNKVFGPYNNLGVIFGTGSMDGHFSCQSLEKEFDHSFLGMEIIEVSELKCPVMETDTHTPDGSKKRSVRPSVLGGCSSKLQKTDEDIKETFSDVANVVTKLATKKAEKMYIPIENVIDVLQALPDVDDELLLDACDLLEDEKKAKTFMALDPTLRKKWLFRKLGR